MPSWSSKACHSGMLTLSIPWSSVLRVTCSQQARSLSLCSGTLRSKTKLSSADLEVVRLRTWRSAQVQTPLFIHAFSRTTQSKSADSITTKPWLISTTFILAENASSLEKVATQSPSRVAHNSSSRASSARIPASLTLWTQTQGTSRHQHPYPAIAPTSLKSSPSPSAQIPNTQSLWTSWRTKFSRISKSMCQAWKSGRITNSLKWSMLPVIAETRDPSSNSWATHDSSLPQCPRLRSGTWLSKTQSHSGLWCTNSSLEPWMSSRCVKISRWEFQSTRALRATGRWLSCTRLRLRAWLLSGARILCSSSTWSASISLAKRSFLKKVIDTLRLWAWVAMSRSGL